MVLPRAVTERTRALHERRTGGGCGQSGMHGRVWDNESMSRTDAVASMPLRMVRIQVQPLLLLRRERKN